MSKVLQAIERQNQRGKQIKLYAKYQAGKYDVMTFADYDKMALQPIYSITKFITCCVVLKVAMQKNIALDTPVFEHWHYEPINPLAQKLTIAQFANMTTGIEWQEIDNYYQADNCFKQFVNSADPMANLFTRKITAEPVFTYNSALSHALAYWIETVTGKPFEYTVERLIFEPLLISDYTWQRDATGRVFGGHGLALRAEDFLKLLPLMTTGCYQNNQVLDHAILKILHSQSVSQVPGYNGYGYGLWHGKIKNAPFIGAFGNAGQRIYYFPTLQQSHAFLGNTKPEFGIQESILKIVL